MVNYTPEEQALIDDVEFAIDYRLEINEEDFNEYKKLMERNKEN